jgi:hypothetical protein
MDVNADNGIYPHHLYMKLDALETELKGWWCDGFYHIEGKPLDLHTEKLEAQIIVTKDGIRDIENGLYARVCSHCGHGMNEGYVWGDGEGYACSDLCLYVDGYTKAQHDKDYADEHIYYTDWEEV